MKPGFRLFADDTEVTELLHERFISLNLRDMRGVESDTVEITLSDTDGAIEWPERDVKMIVFLGYGNQEYGTTFNDYAYKGFYVIDEAEHTGPPDALVLRGRTDNFIEQFKSPKTRSWHQQSINQIVKTIANENDLKYSVDSAYSDTVIEHIDQTEESDLHFLTRMAKRYDAVFKTRVGNVRFGKKGEGKDHNGEDQETITIQRSEADYHNYLIKGRLEYSGVRCYWNSKKDARREECIAGSKNKLKTLKNTFPTKEQAQSAAQGEFDRLRRGTQTAEIELAQGNPRIAAEARVKLEGWKPVMNIEWIVSEVEHILTADGGLSSRLSLELPNSHQADPA